MDLKFLDNFILQSKTGNLKTKDLYPKTLFDLKVKVSFGQGTPAVRPWIAILGAVMSASNGYYPVYLYYKNENILDLSYGVSETNSYNNPWSQEIKDKYITNMRTEEEDFRSKKERETSWIYKTYTPKVENGSVKYFFDEREISSEEMLQDLTSITNDYKKCLDVDIEDESSNLSKGVFHLEKILEDYMIENWEQIPLGKKYDLIHKEGELISKQYATPVGEIDLLVKDKSSGNYVVIELKKNKTSDKAVGQCLRYMGWVKDNLSDKNVKGIIIAGGYDERLHYAQKAVEGIDVFIYEVWFDLKEHARK